MQAFTLTQELETKLNRVAEQQGKSTDQILTDLITEYLQDWEDIHSAEAVLEAIEAGDSAVVGWEKAKQELHGLDH